MATRDRKHELKVFLSDEEERVLEGKMLATHMPSKSSVIRQLIVESMLYEIDYREIREMNAQLSKIGVNINQIAKRINETRSIYQADMDEIKKEVDEIWQLLKSTLLKQPLPAQSSTSAIRKKRTAES